MAVFACGYRAPTKADKKAVRNFAEFMRGVGQRCTLCLHKADRHEMDGCSVKHCGCGDDNLQVLNRRKWAAAPGWKAD